MDPLKGIERAFTTHVGPDAVERLMATVTPLPVILIAGDQLTGKVNAGAFGDMPLTGERQG